MSNVPANARTPLEPVDTGRSRRRFNGRSMGASRKGMTLTEIMVVLVVMLLLMAVMAPSVASVFMVDQRGAAKELVLLYGQLHDEAVMRNVTFRIEYDLRSGSYQVQVSESGTLIFDNPRARQEWEDEQVRMMRQLSEEERAAALQKRESFSTLESRFKTKFELPSGVVFGGVYTPQYGEMVLREDLDEDHPGKVYSYIFANGQAEHTMVWMTRPDGYDDDYTIEVEPLSGGVKLIGERRDPEDSFDFVPDIGPDLPAG